MTLLPLCVAPWKTLTIKTNGDVVPDILYNSKYGNLNNQTLTELWYSEEAKNLRFNHYNNIFDINCQTCKKKEELVGKSRRNFFLDIMPELKYQKYSIDSPPDIYYLDFNMSNKCNLKCIMCNGAISTGWIKDEFKLKDSGYREYDSNLVKYRKNNISILDNLFDNLDHFKNLKYVALRGGEPLYEDLNFKVLDHLCEMGINHKIKLDISTNGTFYDDHIDEYFRKFKEVDLYISIEGIDEDYNFIRGGNNFNFDELIVNIDKFSNIPNVNICFAVTTMAYNVNSLNLLWEVLKKYMNKHTISFSNTVIKPEYLSLNILTKEECDLALEKISHIPSELTWPNKNYNYDTGINNVINGLKNSRHSIKDRNNYISFIRDLHNIR